MGKYISAALLTVIITFFLCIRIAPIYVYAEQETTSAAQADTLQVKAPSPGSITFNFKDANIRNVIRLIAAKSGINIVYGQDVTGTVNMELHDVPWEQALHLVLDLNGYASQREGNVIKVLKKEDVAKEPLVTKVFTLNYSKADKVVSSVGQMLSDRGKIKTDTRSNTIIVTDVPANINNIEKVLAKLDSRTPQVLIETRIVEMKNTFAKDLGIKWSSLKAYKIGYSGVTRTYSSDRHGGQDRTDTYTTDKTETKNWDHFINENTTPNTHTMSIVNTPNLTDAFSRYLLNSDVRTAILSADDFQVVLSALQSNTDVNLVSNPRVVTANNQEAQIKIVDEYPVPKYEFNDSTSSWAITGFNKEDIGVTFNVTPNISTDGYITMKIKPEVTKLVDSIPFTSGGSTVLIPEIGRKKASSKMVIKSGDTLAVGGLMDEDKTNVTTKIPLLGDIPVLGRVFRHKSIENVKKNIVFFITATIIDENNKGIISSANPPAFRETKIDYSKVFKKKNPRMQDKNLSGGNKGYIKQ